MNDRFKSRFFYKHTGKYLTHASYIYCDGRYHLVSTDIDSYPYILISLNESEVIEEQCTGLKDKNEKLIYEGDIVEDKYGYKHLVKFGKHTVIIPVGYENGETECYGWHLNRNYRSCHLNPDDEYLIISNIHENPELLEKEDD